MEDPAARPPVRSDRRRARPHDAVCHLDEGRGGGGEVAHGPIVAPAGTVRPMADMTFRRLGQSGLTVSTIGLGGNNFGLRLDFDASRAVVETALDEGITLIDT